MSDLTKIIEEIQNTKGCTIVKRSVPISIQLDYTLPDDLLFYLKEYSMILFFENSNYPIKIIGYEDFKKSNPIIVGEDVEDDISNDWYIIAIGNNSQYITIDLSKERLGKCYDSFWDRHGVVGENPVIANSFSELLEQLLRGKGSYYYWLSDDFQYLGDAYD